MQGGVRILTPTGAGGSLEFEGDSYSTRRWYWGKRKEGVSSVENELGNYGKYIGFLY